MPTESQKLEILMMGAAQSTRTKYNQQLRTIQHKLAGNVELATLNQILYLLNHVPNPHTRQTYINIIAKLRPDLKLDLKAIRDQNKGLVLEHVNHINSLRHTPTFRDLCDTRDLAYAEGKWDEFLVQALTIDLGLRTMDLQMEITDRETNDLTQNYLIRHSHGVDLVRNRYKTVQTFGRKRHQLTGHRIVHAARQLPAGPFTTRIVDCEPNGVNQSDYFRAQIEHLVANDFHVLRKIQTLCDSRGSSFDQVATHYNIR